MPEPITVNAKGPIPYIDLIVAGLGQVNVAVPVIVAGVSALFAIWKQTRPPADTFETWLTTHPTGTLAEWQAEQFFKFVTALRTEAITSMAEGEAYIAAQGYTRDAFGNLVPPAGQ
jgi:hypothetical protein